MELQERDSSVVVASYMSLHFDLIQRQPTLSRVQQLMRLHITRLEKLQQEKEGLLCRLRQLQQEKERLLNRCQALQNCQPNQPTSSRLEVLCVNNKWKPYEEAICAEIARAQKAGEATCKIDLWGCSCGFGSNDTAKHENRQRAEDS